MNNKALKPTQCPSCHQIDTIETIDCDPEGGSIIHYGDCNGGGTQTRCTNCKYVVDETECQETPED